jgi:NAD(P)-dependent dehydrogenase (short-subunit alcohol dehydrogenase family)
MVPQKPVALVVGASRGIGRQVAIDLAQNGYAGMHPLNRPCMRDSHHNRNTVVVAAKSTSDASAVKPFPPDPNSRHSTISTVEREIRDAGGEAHAIIVDVRNFESVQRMVHETAKVCGFNHHIISL